MSQYARTNYSIVDMTSNLLHSIGRKLQQFFIGLSTPGHKYASSRQDISSLTLGFLGSSINVLALVLPLFTSVTLVRDDLGDAIDQVFSK